MKNTVKLTVLLAAVSLLSLTALQAADKSFKFSIGSNDTLVVNAPDGTQIATLPTATVGKTIDFGSYSFQVSYGQDSNGNLSLIVTANPDHPTDVSFTLDGRSITMDQTSAVTLTLANHGQSVVVDPGYTGSVKVNGQAVTTPVVASAATTGGANTVSPITPAQAAYYNSAAATTATNPTTTADNGGANGGPSQQTQQQQQPTGTGNGGPGDPLTPASPFPSLPSGGIVVLNPQGIVDPITSANPTSPS